MKSIIQAIARKPQALLSVMFFAIISYSTFDRLYWVNGGPGMSGWINKRALPEEFSQCKGSSVEYKQFEKYVDYRCSALGGDLPFWPFIHSGTAPLDKVAAKLP